MNRRPVASITEHFESLPDPRVERTKQHLLQDILWSGLLSFGMLESERRIGEEITRQRRFYISSLNGRNAKTFAHAVRSHWGIENKLHWVLDVAFREDENRVRKDHSAANFLTLRHIALNPLKQEKTAKVGIKIKRNKSGWSENYLLKVRDLRCVCPRVH